MKRITMNIGTHGTETTASEMRKRIAKVVSKIPGDQIVLFNLTLHLENYSPAVVGPIMGELARPEND
jgi:hypothetical protein